MNYRNDNATPRDRIDEDFLKRMLSDEGYNMDFRKMRDNNGYPCFINQNDAIIASKKHDGNMADRCQKNQRENNDCKCSCARKKSGSCECLRKKEENCINIAKECGCKPYMNSCEIFKNQKVQCDDGFTVPRLNEAPLSMVYSPFQEWKNIYEPEEALEHGTIFMELDFPFYPTSCNYNKRCK